MITDEQCKNWRAYPDAMTTDEREELAAHALKVRQFLRAEKRTASTTDQATADLINEAIDRVLDSWAAF